MPNSYTSQEQSQQGFELGSPIPILSAISVELSLPPVNQLYFFGQYSNVITEIIYVLEYKSILLIDYELDLWNEVLEPVSALYNEYNLFFVKIIDKK